MIIQSQHTNYTFLFYACSVLRHYRTFVLFCPVITDNCCQLICLQAQPYSSTNCLPHARTQVQVYQLLTPCPYTGASVPTADANLWRLLLRLDMRESHPLPHYEQPLPEGIQGQFLGLQGQLLGLQGQFLDLQAQFLCLQCQFLGLQGQFLDLKAQFLCLQCQLLGLQGQFLVIKCLFPDFQGQF